MMLMQRAPALYYFADGALDGGGDARAEVRHHSASACCAGAKAHAHYYAATSATLPLTRRRSFSDYHHFRRLIDDCRCRFICHAMMDATRMRLMPCAMPMIRHTRYDTIRCWIR